MAHACNPNYSEGWGRRITWTWEAEVARSWDHAIALQPGQQEQNSISKKKLKKYSKLVTWMRARASHLLWAALHEPHLFLGSSNETSQVILLPRRQDGDTSSTLSNMGYWVVLISAVLLGHKHWNFIIFIWMSLCTCLRFFSYIYCPFVFSF